ncbi:MAG: FAD-dependent oxidoreductase [Acidimicrobiales bacterium]
MHLDTRPERHRIVIIGGGTAGLTVAARLRRAGEADVALIEPSPVHYYQPLWTLVGGGRAPMKATVRPEVSVLPKGVRWIQDAAQGVDPEAKRVELSGGASVAYDALVVAPGIQCDWDAVPGVADTLGRGGVSSNYRPDLAPRTWELVEPLRGGTAVFTAPAGPIKCGGAPQKIAYLAADWWRRQGVLRDVQVILALPGAKLFGVPEFEAVLGQVVERYGIDLRLQTELVEVDPGQREVILADHAAGTKQRVRYDLLHVTPPMSAPDWIKRSPLAGDDAKGWVSVDRATLAHTRWPEVFALGDVTDTPNAKTGAAVRKQAPVVVENLRAALAGNALTARYDGYGSCPFVTARNRVLLAEFDYTNRPTPSIPLIDTARERYDMWLLKRYGLPFLYWNLMLRGLA